MRNVPPGIRIMSVVLTSCVPAKLPATRKRGLASVHACSLIRRCYAPRRYNRVGPWSNVPPEGQNARGDRGTGRWGDCRLAHHEADITMDVLGWEFLPKKRSCRLDRGPIAATHFCKIAAASPGQMADAIDTAPFRRPDDGSSCV